MYWLRLSLLLVLLISLVAVVMLAPAGSILWILGVAIAIAGIILTFIPGDFTSATLGILTLVVLISVAAFIGFTLIGTTGIMVFPLILVILLLSAIWLLTRRSITLVQNGTILMTRTPFRTQLCCYKASTTISPLRRLILLEQDYALIPSYGLVSHITIEKIDTSELQTIKGVTLAIQYKVTDAKKLHDYLLSRTHVLEQIASELNLPLEQAMLRTAFWEHVLHNQLRDTSDRLLRAIVYEKISKAVDASMERDALATEMLGRFSQSNNNNAWGIEIEGLTIPSVDLDPEQIKRKFQDKIKESRNAAEMEATRIELIGIAQARIEAQAIKEWILAIQQAGKPLAPDVIEKIIFNALEKLHEKQRLELIQKNLAPNNAQQQPPPNRPPTS